MLKVNVGMSRKLSRDFNSTGFSVNIEGEVCVTLDDPEGVVEKIKELYDVAEESLAQQIERYESDSAIASRDEQSTERTVTQKRVEQPREAENGHEERGHGNGERSQVEPATNKQIQFLLNLGKKKGLTTPQLESRINEIIGVRCGIYDLNKRQAGLVLDRLNDNGNGARHQSRN